MNSSGRQRCGGWEGNGTETETESGRRGGLGAGHAGPALWSHRPLGAVRCAEPRTWLPSRPGLSAPALTQASPRRARARPPRVSTGDPVGPLSGEEDRVLEPWDDRAGGRCPVRLPPSSFE